MADRQIPNYALYGEMAEKAKEVAVHIEAIADRSPDLDWVIKPHRHGKLFQLLCIFNGELTVQLDDKTHCLEGNWVVTIPMGVVHAFRFRPQSEGVIISVSDDILTDTDLVDGPQYLQPLFENSALIEFASGDTQLGQLRNYVNLLREEFATLHSAKNSALVLLIRLLFIAVRRQFDHVTLDTIPVDSQIRVVADFRKLVENHYKQHWQVTDYADRLNISTSTLNRMCRDQLATSAKSLIQTRVITEAKRRLIFTRQPLEQIAYFLGYKDPAYFSRIFKKVTGESPGEFRRLHDFDAGN